MLLSAYRDGRFEIVSTPELLEEIVGTANRSLRSSLPFS
jgi:hypothetical protein